MKSKIAERMTNVHGDSYSPDRFSAGFEFEGARYHVWFFSDSLEDHGTLYKNPPLTSKRGTPDYFDCRRLRIDSKFAAEAMAALREKLPALRDQAKAAYEAIEAKRLAAAAAASAEYRVKEAGPDLLAACKVAAQWLHDNSDGDEPLRTVQAAIAKAEGRDVTEGDDV